MSREQELMWFKDNTVRDQRQLLSLNQIWRFLSSEIDKEMLIENKLKKLEEDDDEDELDEDENDRDRDESDKNANETRQEVRSSIQDSKGERKRSGSKVRDSLA
jgi:hypothetical protein